MISRTWHGYTTPEDADTYAQLLRSRVLPDIAAMNISGYHGAHLFRRVLGDEVEFVTVLWFDSLESVVAFIGEDYEMAHVPPDARRVLKRFDARSAHYDVILTPDETAP